MATITQHITYQSPSEIVAQCLRELQRTYVLLLENEETDQERYEEAGLTLRCYAESLSVMNNLFGNDGEETEGTAVEDDE